ncbi:TetR/AcrR family transcriptional regulator [Nocardioides sp. KR10-350]|uniref:TetR/AcrR family transcriptional regulator n=1 Tax=Nocardioides cheoyonin TaxID=3156615 RepID=UPI0032B441CD
MSTSARTRLSPEERRAQLLDLGVRLFARRSLEEISIDLLAQEAGISRGLLYHYFGDKVAFREAVVRRAADDLVAQSEPPGEGDALSKLLHSVRAYVDFVDANYEGYLSLVRGAASDPALRAIYDEAFGKLTDRVFATETDVVPDTPASRLLVRGWQAMTEQLVLAWKAGESGVTRDELLDLLVGSLPALMTALPASGA